MADGNYYNNRGQLDPAGEYVRVSTVLDIRRDASLEQYKLNKVAEGGLDALAADKDFYTTRGSAVHSAIETYIRFREEEVLPEDIEPYFNGFKNWFDKHAPESCVPELTLISEQYKYAGTCDLVCVIDGETWLIDWKTSKKHRIEYGLQLAAYRQAYYESTGVWARTGILRLEPKNKSGYSKLKEYDENFEVFLAHLRVFRWAEKHQGRRTPLTEWDGKTIEVVNECAA